MTDAHTRPIANQRIIFREEFDDWAILFDPETGNAFGMNPIASYIWKQLDGSRSIGEIAQDVRSSFDNVPENALDHINEFIQDLLVKGYAGFEVSCNDES